MTRDRQGRKGWLATVAGTSTGVGCPKCHEYPVVYNGNYFCDNWNHPAGPGDCDWAMTSPPTGKRDREIATLIGLDIE